MLKNLFEMMILRSPDGEEGTGGGDQAPNTEIIKEEAPLGGGQPDIIKVGDMEIDRNSPDAVDKLAEAYKTLNKDYTKKAQELSKITKKEPITPVTKEVTPKTVDDKRISIMYEKTINSDLKEVIDVETAKFKEKFGEEIFNKAKPFLDKHLDGIKKLDLGQREKIVSSKNISVFLNDALSKGLSSKEEVKVISPKKDIKNFQEQETLPNSPKAPGAAEISVEKPKIDKSEKPFKRAARLSKERSNESIQSGGSIRK